MLFSRKNKEKGQNSIKNESVYTKRGWNGGGKKWYNERGSLFEKRYSLGPLHHFMVASWVNPMGTSHTRIIRHSIPRGRTREPKFHGLSPWISAPIVLFVSIGCPRYWTQLFRSSADHHSFILRKKNPRKNSLFTFTLFFGLRTTVTHVPASHGWSYRFLVSIHRRKNRSDYPVLPHLFIFKKDVYTVKKISWFQIFDIVKFFC